MWVDLLILNQHAFVLNTEFLVLVSFELLFVRLLFGDSNSCEPCGSWFPAGVELAFLFAETFKGTAKAIKIFGYQRF